MDIDSKTSFLTEFDLRQQEHAQSVRKILERAIETDKVNFTQVQLHLAAVNAPPFAYYVLRNIMEHKFKLQPLM